MRLSVWCGSVAVSSLPGRLAEWLQLGLLREQTIESNGTESNACAPHRSGRTVRPCHSIALFLPRSHAVAKETLVPGVLAPDAPLLVRRRAHHAQLAIALSSRPAGSQRVYEREHNSDRDSGPLGDVGRRATGPRRAVFLRCERLRRGGARPRPLRVASAEWPRSDSRALAGRRRPVGILCDQPDGKRAARSKARHLGDGAGLSVLQGRPAALRALKQHLQQELVRCPAPDGRRWHAHVRRPAPFGRAHGGGCRLLRRQHGRVGGRTQRLTPLRSPALTVSR
eukprot:scaffold31608_cov63-Phaeocystis_antarctica.AAC.6